MSCSEFVFVGGVYPKDQENEILSKSKRRPQIAANNYQWNLINGFDHNLKKPVMILNKKYVGSFPKNYSEALVKGGSFSHIETAKDIDLGFVNISIIRNIIPPFREKKYINDILKNGARNVFFFYSIGERNLRIAEYVKHRAPNTIVGFYIPDLPQFVMLSVKQSVFVRAHRACLAAKVKRTLRLSDINVLITEHQAEKLDINQDNCIVVEAFAETVGKRFAPIQNTGTFNIIYAGTLARQYDVLDLVSAFMRITDSNARLFICGDGDAVPEIKDAEKSDDRIKFLGVLNKDELASVYRKACLLVNPRRKGKGFTKYSFPSKTIDYMCAGRPVLCQHLEGIPREYDDYLIYYDDNKTDGVNSLENSIKEIMNLSIDRLNEIGRNNFNFVVNNKNEISQTQKIVDYIKCKFSDLEI